MQVICWNIQGIKKTQVILEVKFLIKNQKSDIMFFIEIWLMMLTFCLFLGLTNFDNVSPVNQSGRLTVTCNNDTIHAFILFKDNRSIHLLVYNIKLGTTSILFGVYGPAKK